MKPLALAPALLLATWFLLPGSAGRHAAPANPTATQTPAQFAQHVQGADDLADMVALKRAVMARRVEQPPAEQALVAAPATPIPAPPPQPVTLEGSEAVICSQAWPCTEALTVARCESGPDYTAGFNRSWHGGTFQISSLHAWRFAQRGWDFWTDALVLERNISIAFELWSQQGWRPWSCRPR